MKLTAKHRSRAALVAEDRRNEMCRIPRHQARLPRPMDRSSPSPSRRQPGKLAASTVLGFSCFGSPRLGLGCCFPPPDRIAFTRRSAKAFTSASQFS